MAVLLGAIDVGSKYESLDYLHQSVLNQIKKDIKKESTIKLKSAYKELKSAYDKYKLKSPKLENLYNEAQRLIILKEIKSRK
jgi:hypothetical protein